MPIDPARVKALFVDALDLPQADRAEFLSRECAGDEELLARLQKLLAAHDDAPTADRPQANTGAYCPDGTGSWDRESVGEVGQLVAGRYKLLEPIGEGGMGSVWMAEQRDPVKRLVALKLIKAGMDSKAVLARFEAERQALAVMDHPNIAKVLDGGATEDGRPYFVMELVKGTPITNFCDARRLTLRQRLELFIPVCSAIQHAHMKGIIHRDIKPSNVLVALYDDKAVPKVIDFGIAKATGQALTDKTLHTGFGAVVGTPEYMSPEQASLNNLDIDTRSDVYSLGVLMYELLTGTPPFTKKELETAGLLEMLRVVREQEPSRPSLKLSTLASRPSIAANRGLEPGSLAKQLRSELDWMVMKSLEKDRNRRYDSPNSLAADVQRYLSGEQVQAVPPSLSYRLRKWVRKNRGLVITSGLVAATLSAGIVGTTWQAIRAENEAERVREEQKKTQAALDQAERNLVGSFLRPIGYNTEGFDPAELIAFDELARQEDDHIKMVFLRKAMSNGDQAVRVTRPIEKLAQAVVGTSLKRRSQVLEFLSQLQRDSNTDPRVKVAAAWLAIELGAEEILPFDEYFDTLLTQKNLADWNQFTSNLSQRIHPKLRSKLSHSLIAVLGKSKNEKVLHTLAMNLWDLTRHSTPSEQVRVFDLIVTSLGKWWIRVSPILINRQDPAGPMGPPLVGQVEITDVFAREQELIAFISRLDSHAAWRATEAMLQLYDEPSIKPEGGVTEVLASLALRLDASSSSRCFAAILARLRKSKIWGVSDHFAKLLPILAEKVDSSTLERAFDTQLQILLTEEGDSLFAAVLCLKSLSPFLPPARSKSIVKRTAEKLLELMLRTTNGSVMGYAGRALADLAPFLDSETALKGFDFLVKMIGKPIVENSIYIPDDALATLANRLDPKLAQAKAVEATEALIAIIRKKSEDSDLRAAEECLVTLSPFLEPVTAGRAFDALLTIVGRTVVDTGFIDISYANGMGALSERLDGESFRSGLNSLLEVLGKSTDLHAVIAARRSLISFLPRLDRSQRSSVGNLLFSVAGKWRDIELQEIRQLLNDLGSTMDPETCSMRFEALLGEIQKTNPGDDHSLYRQAEVLGALFRYVDSPQRTRFFDFVVEKFAKMSMGQPYSYSYRDLLERLAPFLDSASASRGFASSLKSIEASSTTGSPEVWAVLDGMARRLDAAAASQFCPRMLALLESKERTHTGFAGSILSSLAQRLDPSNAIELAHTLEAIQDRTLDEYHDDVICPILLRLLPKLPESIREGILHRCIGRALAYSRLSGSVSFGPSNGPPSDFVTIVEYVNSIPFLVDLLRDPGTVGKFRETVLQRLEDLAYSDPLPQVRMIGMASNFFVGLTIPAIHRSENDYRKQTRRFRTVSDAAKWLAEHHPEIDLDRPYHKRDGAK